jgi:hypothetical protein
MVVVGFGSVEARIARLTLLYGRSRALARGPAVANRIRKRGFGFAAFIPNATITALREAIRQLPLSGLSRRLSKLVIFETRLLFAARNS